MKKLLFFVMLSLMVLSACGLQAPSLAPSAKIAAAPAAKAPANPAPVATKAPVAAALPTVPDADAKLFQFDPVCKNDGVSASWDKSMGVFEGSTFVCKAKKWQVVQVMYKGQKVQAPVNTWGKIPAPVAAATQPPVAAATKAPAAPAAAATQAPVVKASDPVATGTCSLTDGTAQVQVVQKGSDWTFDPNAPKAVAGYDGSKPGHDASALAGCSFLSEFEAPAAQEHHIQILRDTPGQPLAFLSDDGLYHCPDSKGCSIWAIPQGWNVDNWATPKPSIAQEFASNKRVNQKRNGYNWPIIVYMPDGSTKTFATDYVFGGFYIGCKDLTAPAAVNVAGTIQADGSYNASIGMEGCTIAVKLNGNWTFWHDAKDNVAYSGSIQAWLFPAGTSDTDVTAWIAKQ